jgi:hypothetical protein
VLEDRTVPSTFTVTNTGDNGGVNPAPGAGTGTLRQAIVDANTANTGTAANPDLIQFNVPITDPGYQSGPGVFFIKPLSGLPTITDTVDLNGYTQPEASPNTLVIGDNAVLKIVLDGSLAGAVEGLVIEGGNSKVRGLAVDNFAYGSGIVLSGSGNHLVVGNFIGTDVTGASAAANNNGIYTTGPSNTIGGTAPADRNIISGNSSGLPDSADGRNKPSDCGIDLHSSGNLIQGNYIGTDKSGMAALANGGFNIGGGVVDGSTSANQTIGGTAPGAGNLISGNTGTGIFLGNDSFCLVIGNLIGTNATGTAALGNGGPFLGGIELWGNYNTIGGTTPGARNIISGNDIYGISIEPVFPGGAQHNLVEGNYIGTDITGTTSLGKQGGGILIAGSYNTIGGTTGTARNLISGNGPIGGIQIKPPYALSAKGNVVQGNYIGTDANGTHSVRNGQAGIVLAGGTTDNSIGGTLPGEGNLISGGISLFDDAFFGGDPTHNLIEGNLIGTNYTGTAPLDVYSEQGIYIRGGDYNTIGGTVPGAANTIAFNNLDGVLVYSGTGNSVLGNSIFSNVSLGIFLNSANNANNNQAFPILTSVSSTGSGTTITGTLQSVPSTTFRIEFFANAAADPSGYGEGQTYLGFTTVTTTSSGAGSFSFTLTTPLPAGQTIVSATATNLTTGDTSPFCFDFSVPIVGAITGVPLAPVALNTALNNVSASFTDANPAATHTALWNWGDNTTSGGAVSEATGSGTVTGSHTYTTPGVYTITVTVTNTGGGSGQATYQFVVVYDPNGGFVTGGGWITSPPGAYPANPALTGKATFGFVSKYQKGTSVPSGNTQFHFDLANLEFHSTSYDWLVIAGAKAQYKGSGQINNAGDDGFLLTAIDGALPGGGGQDRFRIKIWDKATGTILYDNQLGASYTADPTTVLGGGEIVIHSSSGSGGAWVPLPLLLDRSDESVVTSFQTPVKISIRVSGDSLVDVTSSVAVPFRIFGEAPAIEAARSTGTLDALFAWFGSDPIAFHFQAT